MKKIMHILFLSCLRATELIEKKLNLKLSVKEKIQLRTHKMMCNACSNYEKQSVFIEKGISLHRNGEFSAKDIEQLKHTIVEKLSDTT
jgi:hypothetical protein